jgi:hypothetical protein
VHSSPGIELTLVQIGLAAGARHPQDRQRAQRVQVGDDERGLKVLGGVVHLRGDRACTQHLAVRVDRAVMINDPTVWILLPHLLELTALDLVRLDAGAHRVSPDRRPYSRLASLMSACRVQSSRTSSGRSTTTP